MISMRTWRNGLLIAAAGLLVACASDIATPERSARKGDGARIEMGVGHLNRDGKAFHYWDKQKEIPAVCARCHAREGVPEYLKTGKNAPAQHVKNAFACTNCHADMVTYERHKVSKVTFPSGVTVDSGDNNKNLCMTCHQGRESTASVNKALAGMAADTPNPKLNFIHVHYFPAGATLYGGEAKVGYEYAGKKYVGRFKHTAGVDTCTACHEVHTGEVRVELCGSCHQGIKADPKNIRMAGKGDFNGDGREDSMAREIESQKAALYAAIQQYASAAGGSAIAFTPDGHPYWYTDTNGNGQIDKEEFNPKNNYKAYTPRLMQAIYNYTYVLRDPGAPYHNGRYAGQLLYDSLESLNASGKASVNMAGKVRP
ncbi:MAG: hypothetical protein A3G27_15070 [Betaproteobacteria bacterium RIFCSPLOWO2_12_FULL_66_14]|nr:MAG: hypothetical protein A3G27_15070 [Betaproteobacteria bacterium RIFCSPLOWO2_12_FULL_66_14]